MRFGFCLLAAAAVVAQTGTVPSHAGKRMSIHNRILLNRLAVSGHTSLQVMLMVDDSRIDDVSRLVDRLHGHVRREDRAIGYLRAEVPIDVFTTLVADPAVVAYQISSLSKGTWYRDALTEAYAESSRDREVGAVTGSLPSSASGPQLPLLSAEAARAPGYTADDDAGAGAWLSEHPTFDGRGVTIAFIESAQPEFAHPMLTTARALDGHLIPKIAGILNTLDDDELDQTRVDLSTQIRAQSTWCRIGTRTYIVPRPGTYRFGIFSLPAGTNLVEQIAVLEQESTGEMWIDTNGDADFRDEPALPDVNTRFEAHKLQLRYPHRIDPAFVVARGAAPHRVHVYISRDEHLAMTWTVAAGSRTEDGFAGVAPGARALFVRHNQSGALLHDYFEACIDAVERTDVDIVSVSIVTILVPDTAADFGGVFFQRLVDVYRKPIFHSAANTPELIGNIAALGGVFSVGSSISPKAFAALFGGADLAQTVVQPISTGGPALDGSFKPDFVAPAHRVAGGLFLNKATISLPKNVPAVRLPRGYSVSGGTSASAPYAAGVAALLLSAAKQLGIPYSVESLGRALRAGAHFLPNEPAHLQGAGTIDVGGAWRELRRGHTALRIRVSGPNVHTLTAYAAHGAHGAGLYEREGWAPGMRGMRVLQFRRESGPEEPVTYRLTWTGNDGTFAGPASVTLPLNQSVAVPLTISAATVGAHSAVLNLRDAETDAIVMQTMPTIVAAARLDSVHPSTVYHGIVPLMHDTSLYVSVPADAGAIAVDLDVLRGSLTAGLLPSDGMVRDFFHVMPLAAGRTLAKGRYGVILPRPTAGVWSVTLMNDSAWRETNPALLSLTEAEYAVSVRLLSASVKVQSTSGGKAVLSITNLGAPLHDTAVDVSTGTLKSISAETEPSGLPNQIAIEVPDGASTLALDLHGTSPTATLELHLYDCTSGECFSYDFTVPAAHDQSMVIRDPHPGRWIAAVNTAPFLLARERFVLDEIITRAVGRQASSTGPHPPGDRWTQFVDLPREHRVKAGGTPIVLFELVDTTDERENKAHPWENRKELVNFADRPAAIGRAILAVK